MGFLSCLIGYQCCAQLLNNQYNTFNLKVKGLNFDMYSPSMDTVNMLQQKLRRTPKNSRMENSKKNVVYKEAYMAYKGSMEVD